MSDSVGRRIRPLARRLDSLSGSPTNSGSRLVSLAPSAPRSGAQSPNDVEMKDVKPENNSEAHSVKDILAQARRKESEAAKLAVSAAPGGRAPKSFKPVVQMDVSVQGDSMLSGGSRHIFSGEFSHVETDAGFVALQDRCAPLEVPFASGRNESSMLNFPSKLLEEDKFVLFQLPALLPTYVPQSGESMKDEVSVVPESSGGGSRITKRGGPNQKSKVTERPMTTRRDHGTLLSDIPDGVLGTVRVHKSGNAILDIGGTQFEISEGQSVGFRTELACVCPAEGEILFLGEASKRLVVTPVIGK